MWTLPHSLVLDRCTRVEAFVYIYGCHRSIFFPSIRPALLHTCPTSLGSKFILRIPEVRWCVIMLPVLFSLKYIYWTELIFSFCFWLFIFCFHDKISLPPRCVRTSVMEPVFPFRTLINFHTFFHATNHIHWWQFRSCGGGRLKGDSDFGFRLLSAAATAAAVYTRQFSHLLSCYESYTLVTVSGLRRRQIKGWLRLRLHLRLLVFRTLVNFHVSHDTNDAQRWQFKCSGCGFESNFGSGFAQDSLH